MSGLDKFGITESIVSVPIVAKPEKVDYGTELKGEAIIAGCIFNQRGKCHCIQSDPEALACLCPQFVTHNRGAIERFDALAREYKCASKVEREQKYAVTYWDLHRLMKERRK